MREHGANVKPRRNGPRLFQKVHVHGLDGAPEPKSQRGTAVTIFAASKAFVEAVRAATPCCALSPFGEISDWQRLASVVYEAATKPGTPRLVGTSLALEELTEPRIVSGQHPLQT